MRGRRDAIHHVDDPDALDRQVARARLASCIGIELVDQTHQQPRDLADRTIVRAAEVGDEHWGAVAQVVRARVLLSDGNADEAKRIARQAERVLAAVGDQIQRAHALRVVAAASEVRGEPADADRAFKQSIDLLSSIDDRADLSLAAAEYSKVLRARGSIDEAFAMLELAQTRR